MGSSSSGDKSSCPSRADLAAFLSAALPAAARAELGAHVAACEACAVALRRMGAVTAGPETAGLGPRGAGVRTPSGRDYDPATPEPPRTRFFSLIRPQHQPPPERLGQYRLLDRLGEGGMGAVYRAEHTRLKRDVAVKVLSPGQATDPRAAARFQMEMEVVGGLDHPNLVRATDAGEADGFHFLVMDLIDGIDLARLLARGGALRVADACEIARQAAIGLQAAHDRGLVHRDVKPSNVMLTAAGGVKVLDLGLALLRSGGPPAGDLTGVGEVMGTAEYMAPEQAEETHAVDGRADVYSLGCTLYALLTGAPPFTSSDRRPFAVMAAHQSKPVPPVTDRRSDVPPELAALLARMLAKRPDDRPASPGAVAAELKLWTAAADLPALAATVVPGEKTVAGVVRDPVAFAPTTPEPAAPRRRRRYAVAAALLVTAGLAGIGGWLVPDRTDPPGPPPAAQAATNGWRNLLDRPLDDKAKRLWPAAVDARLDHDAGKETLFVQTPHPGLVRLGEAAGPYRLQVGMRQIRWPGGVGVYFGGRTEGNDFVFQYVRLCRTDAGPGREFALTRARGIVTPGVTGVKVVEFATEYIAPPGGGEYLLELEPQPNGLSMVRWNGAACPKLIGGDALGHAAALFPDGGMAGEFGVYVNGAVATVSTARVSLTE